MKATLGAILFLAGLQARPPGNGPEVGTEAPNFTAKVLASDRKVELKAVLAGERKPVVLIFGSTT